jgi:hypothetical protein
MNGRATGERTLKGAAENGRAIGQEGRSRGESAHRFRPERAATEMVAVGRQAK